MEPKKCEVCGKVIPQRNKFYCSRKCAAFNTRGRCVGCGKTGKLRGKQMCQKCYLAAYYKENKVEIRKKAKVYYLKNKAQFILRSNNWRKQNPEKRKLVLDRYNKNYPEKRLARSRVADAIRYGKMKRLACVKCGKKAQAHHPDYSKALDVVWLCPAHHAETHRYARLQAR